MMSTHLKRWRPQSLRFGLLFFVGCILLLPARSVAAPKQTLADLPLPAQAAIAATLGKDQPAYHARQHGAGFIFENPRHAFTATLTGQGLTLTQGTSTLALQLTGYGYGMPSQPIRPTKPTARENRVEYRRGSLTEWYVNGPLGLEQGITLGAPPSARRAGPLTLALSLGGDLTPRVEATKTAATLLSRTGASELRYTGLTVTDATGATLPAWLTADDSRLLIQVNDARAQYPLTIDPFIQQAKLTASDGAPGDFFGVPVSISGDTVVVGAYQFINGPGAAYVFVKSSGGWATMTESAKLTASDGAVGDFFGGSVAISGDTVVVGDVGVNLDPGAAYVFVKPGSGWATMTETAKLTASDGTESFGGSVAISGDTVVVGAPGAAYVFGVSGITTGPDLTGRWPTLVQLCRSTRAGQRCWLRGIVEITNQGDQKAPRSSFLRFYLSADATFDPATDTFLRQVAVGALRPGMSQRKRLSVPLPPGQNATGKVVLAVIDATDRIVESDKTNNVVAFGPLP